MKTLEEIKKNPKLRNVKVSMDGGTAVIHIGGWDGSVIWSTGAGWDHVSVSPFAKRIVPDWECMCAIKDIFWNENEAVIQIHPPKAEYVNELPSPMTSKMVSTIPK